MTKMGPCESSTIECVPTSVAQNLYAAEGGIWFSAGRKPVSYAEDGNAECYAVEEDSFWFEHRNACLLATLQRLPPGGLFYDIGGGNGFVSRALLDGGFATVLVEPGEVGARNARSRGLPVVICATMCDAGFHSNALPAIGLFDVLEHVDDTTGFLQELHRCLIPGGRLYVTVPAYSWLWSDDDIVAGHFRRYTRTKLRMELQSVGFRPIYSTYFFSLLPPALLLVRSLPSLFGRRALRRECYSGLHRCRVGKLMDTIWAAERRQIAQGRSVPFGSSCLLVAEKY